MVQGVSLPVKPGGRPKSMSPLGPRLTQLIPDDLLGMRVGDAHDGPFHSGREAVDLDHLQRGGTPTADHVDVARWPLHHAEDPEGGTAADDPVHGLGALDRERVVELAEQGMGGGGIDHGGFLGWNSRLQGIKVEV
jgi:hypothetical protein